MDLRLVWPLRQTHPGGFFMVRIDCQGDKLVHRLKQSWPAAEKSGVG